MAFQPVIGTKASNINPGDLALVEVEGTRIAIANANGRLYAVDDTCTHEECSLAEGILEGTIVTCPCHGAQFDVTSGKVVAPPAPEPVKSYPVRVQDDQILIEV